MLYKLYEFDVNSNVYLNSVVDREILKVDSILKAGFVYTICPIFSD